MDIDANFVLENLEKCKDDRARVKKFSDDFSKFFEKKRVFNDFVRLV